MKPFPMVTEWSSIEASLLQSIEQGLTDVTIQLGDNSLSGPPALVMADAIELLSKEARLRAGMLEASMLVAVDKLNSYLDKGLKPPQSVIDASIASRDECVACEHSMRALAIKIPGALGNLQSLLTKLDRDIKTAEGTATGVNLFGLRNIPNVTTKDITIDAAAKFIEEMFPEIWRAVNVKFIEAPGSHCGFKAVAVAFASSIAEMSLSKKAISAANNIAACACVLASCNFPTYYVSKSLLQALQRSSPPKGMTWSDEKMKLPFPGLVFMLPRGTLYESTGAEVILLGIATFESDVPMVVPGTKITVRGWKERRLSAFWAVDNCMTMQDCTFPTTQMLEPDPGWINTATEQFRKAAPDEDGGDSGEFSSYMIGLLANLLLVKQARPELVETGTHTGKRLKSGVFCHSPNFIGRKYAAMQSTRVSAGGKFTELDWRCGHFKNQRFGAGRKESKVIWIDPYIAYVRGLV